MTKLIRLVISLVIVFALVKGLIYVVNSHPGEETSEKRIDEKAKKYSKTSIIQLIIIQID